MNCPNSNRETLNENNQNVKNENNLNSGADSQNQDSIKEKDFVDTLQNFIVLLGLVKIGFFNIASSPRDQSFDPLSGRIGILCDMIKDMHAKHSFDFFCVQEIRPSGKYSALQLIMMISECLNMEFVYQRINAASNAFYRATFYSAKFWPYQTINHYTPNSREPQYGRLALECQFMKSDTKESFGEVGANVSKNIPMISIINAHAPLDGHKFDYYKLIAEIIHKREEANMVCFGVGDFNKFTEQRGEYDNLLEETNVVDHVPKESITFVSFPYDLDKAGNIMRSSLDGFITSRRFADKNNVKIEIESTDFLAMNEDGILKRPTDHFLMVAGINN